VVIEQNYEKESMTRSANEFIFKIVHGVTDMIEYVDKEDLEIRVISSSNEIVDIESDWNALVNTSCNNPFLLSEFVRRFIDSNHADWDPLVLIVSAKNSVVGIAPFMTKKKLGVRSVKFVHKSVLSPDFIICDQYREQCIAQTLEFLFKTLKCKFAALSFPVESPNFQILKQQCKANRIHLRTSSEMGHRVLPVNCTWNEFESMRGKNFRNQFKKTKRKLDQAGSWKITCSSASEVTYAVRKILDVEKTSWKEAWRIQRNEKTDTDLMTIIKAMQHTAEIEPSFKWNVWFLELSKQTLAYLLVLRYKEVAFLTKTSYNERYRRFYPGQYLRNSVIRELFNNRQVKSIDFLTDLSHHRTWTSICLPRVGVTLANGTLPTITKSVFEKIFG
jgi:CelD/BcsL family acetyltransferase involved in cellulose biosynthesis